MTIDEFQSLVGELLLSTEKMVVCAEELRKEAERLDRACKRLQEAKLTLMALGVNREVVN